MNQIKHLLFFIFISFQTFTAEIYIDPLLPKFIIIGAQKSGTGAFYEILRQHPLIVDRPGEVHFFDLYFDKGIQWYKAQYPQNKNRNAIRGDKSPYYLFHPLAPQRAHSILPNAKLIVLLRNPVNRAYSQYMMSLSKKKETLSFEDAIEAESERLSGATEEIIRTGITDKSANHRIFSYLSRGNYAEQLRNWMQYYKEDQILVIIFEDFLKNPKEQIEKTLNFLGLPKYQNFNFNVGKKSTYQPMDPTIRKTLSDYFKPLNSELEVMLNRKLNWD